MDNLVAFSPGVSFPDADLEVERSTSVHLLSPEEGSASYRVHTIDRYGEDDSPMGFADAFDQMIRGQSQIDGVVIDATAIGDVGIEVLDERLQELRSRGRLTENVDPEIVTIEIVHGLREARADVDHVISRRDLSMWLDQARFAPTRGSFLTPPAIAEMDLQLDPGLGIPENAPVVDYWRIGPDDDRILPFALGVWALEAEELRSDDDA